MCWYGTAASGTAEGDTTDNRRVGIAMNIVPATSASKRTSSSAWPSPPSSVSPSAQQLVGYGIYNGLIGHIDKRVPTNLLLESEEDSHLLWDYAIPPAN